MERLAEVAVKVLAVSVAVHVLCLMCECERSQSPGDDRERARCESARRGHFEAGDSAIPVEDAVSVTTMRSLSSFTSRTR